VIQIREIDHVVLRVSDVVKMRAFYCDVLGCSIEKIQESFGLIQLRAGNALLDLVAIDGVIGSRGGAAPGGEGRNMDHICFRVAPFDADVIAQHLEHHGVPPGAVESRYGSEGQGPSIYIEDPEGNVVELKGPPDLAVSA